MTDELVMIEANDAGEPEVESADTNIKRRRLDKKKFVAVVKEYTRPGRPAYAALARAIGDMLNIGITLAEPLKCPACGKVFVPWAKTQTHCSIKCSNTERQRRYRAKQKPGWVEPSNG